MNAKTGRDRPLSENLSRWAEVTALALALRKSYLALKFTEDEAEVLVWKEVRDSKEKAWTTAPS